MKKTLNALLITLVLLVAHIVSAAPLQMNQATVKGLSLSSSMNQVVQVMGNPYRTRHWKYTYDTMYEYPGVNFVFLTKYGSLNQPMTKIILDAPQASLDNGLKVGVTSDAVMDKFGTDYSFNPVNDEMVYQVIIDPTTYTLGFVRFEFDGKVVKRIFVERSKE